MRNAKVRFVHLDPPGLIGSWEITEFGSGVCQMALSTAPSMTTPAVTYFQSATSSFRASDLVFYMPEARGFLRLSTG
jgi:hypothetical protein